MNIFAKATKLKMRFQTSAGLLSVEDLWDLPLETKSTKAPSLDSIAQGLDVELKQTATTSFVKKTPVLDSNTELKLEVVKAIIAVKLEEQEAAASATARRAEKQRLLSIIAAKEDSALENLSLEELKAKVAAL